ncbi:hypothetical protein KO495_07460 [Colwellia sp. D2M02]|uniref:hypothetical protein n=1 Tax=Colwellia sp. D2M02 TaxID=2841562 RepID=UPI001C0A549F|nr:hypothetical protein [Colwellia sp. D2M02]MBU2893163.1 hypothetical protein [Colwellia sp. D2M02]
MFKAVPKVLIITAMLIAFIGQTLTFNTAIPCEPDTASLSPSITNLVKSYDSTITDTAHQEDCCGINCCDNNCTCITNACSLLIYIDSKVASTKVVAISEAIYREQPEQPSYMSDFLYRPPIVTS